MSTPIVEPIVVSSRPDDSDSSLTAPSCPPPPQNQYYNKEDMEAMVAATVMAEKTAKEKNDAYFQDPIQNDVAKKKRRVLVTS